MPKQLHTGSGDNVGRDKILNILISNKILIFSIVGITIVGLLLILFSNQIKKVYYINGTVVKHAGTPAVNHVLEIDLDSNGEPILLTTDANGSFSYLVHNIPDSIGLKVLLSNKVLFENSYEGNSVTSFPISIKLPVGNPPFRVTYWILDELTFKFITNDAIDLIAPFFQNSVLIKNDALDNAIDLYKNYSYEPPGGLSLSSVFYNDKNIGREERYNISRERISFEESLGYSTKIFANTFRLPETNPRTESYYDSNKWGVFRFELESDLDNQSEMLWRNGSIEDYLNFTYEEWKVHEAGVLNDIDEDDLEYEYYVGSRLNPYKYLQSLGKQNIPKYFGIEVLMNETVYYCETWEPKLHGLIVIPDVSLVVMQIENIRNDPLRLEQFFFKRNDNSNIRYHFQDLVEQKHSSRFISSPLARPILEGEKIIVPLYLYLNHSDFFIANGEPLGEVDYGSNLGYKYNYTSDVHSKITKLNANNDGEAFDSHFLNENQEIINFKINAPSIDSLRFVLGPSYKLDSIVANNAIFPIREFDPNKLFVDYGVVGGASCPYVYTYNRKTMSWINEGVIIYGHSSKDKEAFNYKSLSKFHGQILIKEVDPETSYLNEFRIELYGKDGEKEYLSAIDAKLALDDDQYIILEEGEEYIVNFEERKYEFEISNVILVSKGYYIPYIYNTGSVFSSKRK